MTTAFTTMTLPAQADVLAPDGSEVRLLPRLDGGSMAHFALPPGQISKAVRHRTVEEIWFVIAGAGEMWRALDGQETVEALAPGAALTIPVGTRFQFRASAISRLEAIAITMPPWPGADEVDFVAGKWDDIVPPSTSL
jgi:mannose-6-phosphate isomerase-like protein (cupin superfamily)